MSIEVGQSAYDQIAEQYAQSQQRPAGNGFSWNHDLVIPHLLKVAGDVAGLSVLDAGCGDGIVARYLAERRATVVGIDVSSGLIQLAEAQNEPKQIHYLVHDLSRPLPRYVQHFDLVVSNLVLNDVADYQGFATTLGAVTKKDGRLILSLTNPYSAVMREKVESYFDSGTATPYPWGEGKVYHFHRTLQEYIAAFRSTGFLLNSLTDVQMTAAMVAQLPAANREFPWFDMYQRFPFFVVLEFCRLTK
ncbi:MAG: class I SAM-dependent methyltransferase [Caldilineaceae bacterium]